MSTWTTYRPGELRVGMTVVTGEDEPWSAHPSAVRTETVTAVGLLVISTDRGTYFRNGRQTQLQPLPHPRRILSRSMAD